MSVDNSVVDSSVTEWKPDVENKNNQDHCCEQVGISNANKRNKSNDTRYFIIKSLNHENIQSSIERGIWATQAMNEPILEEAYHNCGKVILIYSVNMSGYFQGYAEMMSSVGWRRDNVWSHGSRPWGHSFKVKWLQLQDLPFQKTLHLKNPLNNYKPVKISRDCQELPQDIGEALCELIDGENENHTSCGLQNEEYPLMYPSMVYQGGVDVGWDMCAERYPHYVPTDDDILEMTYEDYLEAHGRALTDSDSYSRSRAKKRSRHHSPKQD